MKLLRLALLAFSIIASDAGAETFTVTLPQTQNDFIAVIREFEVKYEEAPNELKKSTVVKQREDAIKRILPNQKFENWVGQIQNMGTTSEGNAYLVLGLKDYSFVIKTYNNSFSDIGDNTLIKNGSNIYNALAELDEGDWVKASGKLIRPSALTERGSMIDPEFLVKFSSVSPVMPGDAAKIK